LPPTVALLKSGYWVLEWLPQIVSLAISVTGVEVLADSWAIARL